MRELAVLRTELSADGTDAKKPCQIKKPTARAGSVQSSAVFQENFFICSLNLFYDDASRAWTNVISEKSKLALPKFKVLTLKKAQDLSELTGQCQYPKQKC